MKAAALIADAMSEWREFRDAPDLAHELFDHLDPDEITRLALRGLSEEIRRALRSKDEHGVPQYASILAPAEDGTLRRVYKQTALFEVEDYRVAIKHYQREASANMRVAKALTEDCYRRLGVQLKFGRGAA